MTNSIRLPGEIPDWPPSVDSSYALRLFKQSREMQMHNTYTFRKKEWRGKKKEARKQPQAVFGEMLYVGLLSGVNWWRCSTIYHRNEG